MNWYEIGIVMSEIGLVMIGAGMMIGFMAVMIYLFLNN